MKKLISIALGVSLLGLAGCATEARHITGNDVGGGLRAKLGAFLLKDNLRGLKKQLNYSDVGGAVLFGVKAPVVKTHGSSDAKAVYSTIRQIRTMLETDVVAQTAREFSGE